MAFRDLIQSYMEELGCSPKELSAASGLSPMAIRRYLNGQRIPAANSEAMSKLAHGLAVLSGSSEEEILINLKFSAQGFSIDYKILLEKLNILFSELQIQRNDISHHLNFDPSYISRILSGNRRPSDVSSFVSNVSEYVSRRFTDSSKLLFLLELTDYSADADGKSSFTERSLKDAVSRWLLSSESPVHQKDDVSHFLSQLDQFDLNEYIRAIHFDKLKVPMVPFLLPSSRWCYGLREMMEGEIDFLASTALSRAKDPVIMYSDMPMDEMSKDPEFPKKWMIGMAALLKKGLKLQMIHNIDRPFHEMMLGLEAFIPMYMTGQIEPYYLNHPQNDVFLHFIRSSGAAAVGGEGISGRHADGRYYFSRKEEDIRYYQKRAQLLLAKSKPLMKIYLQDRQEDLYAFFQESIALPGTRRFILSSPPIWTMSEALLRKILSGHDLPEAGPSGQICALRRFMSSAMEEILKANEVVLELPALNQEEFTNYPVSLDLSGTFMEANIILKYNEYEQLQKEAHAFADAHKNLTIKESPASAFRNIQIMVHQGKHVIVTKNKAPSIVFVISHPTMVKAFEHFVVPVIESDE